MFPIIHGQDISGANQFRDTISKYTNKSYEEICHGTISDAAAAGIATFLYMIKIYGVYIALKKYLDKQYVI